MMNKIFLCVVFGVSLLPSAVLGAETGFYVKSHLDWSSLSDDKITVDGASGQASYDSGFATGIGFGYDYGNGWRNEVDFEYRTNEYSRVSLDNSNDLSGGDFSSAILYLHGIYQFKPSAMSVTPYVGLGLGWVQEIDFDASADGVTRSYSDSGDLAYRLLAGIEHAITEQWHFQAQVNYTQLTGLKLKEEGGLGTATSDYSVWGVGLGLVFKF